MVDEEIKQQVIDVIKDRKFFKSKRVARELNISAHIVGRVLKGIEGEGLIEKWNGKQWTWVET